MCAAKQPIGRLLAVERTSVREGTDDAPQQQKLEHEAGHLDQGRGGLSGTGYSGFARLNAARSERSISRADCGKPFFSRMLHLGPSRAALDGAAEKRHVALGFACFAAIKAEQESKRL